MGKRQTETEARAAKRTRVTARPSRPLWDRWRLWLRIKNDGQVLTDVPKCPRLLLGLVELIGDVWRSRTPNGGWFSGDDGQMLGFKNKLDAVERLLQHMAEAARG
jgi:hypothetical protein